MSSEIAFDVLTNRDHPVTAGHMKWLAEGGQFTPDAVQEILDLMRYDFVEADRSDGSGRLRASSFYSVETDYWCDRLHILSYMGVPQDLKNWSSIDIMNAGTFLHYYYQMAGLSAGWLADVEAPIEHEPWYLRGQMDGILRDGTGLEIKTTASYSFNKISTAVTQAQKKDPGTAWKAVTNGHLWQIHLYMKATGIDKFSLVYVNRDTPSKFLEVRVPWSTEIGNRLENTMERLATYIDHAQLPPMLDGCMQMKGPVYDNCNYRSECPHVSAFG